MAEVVWPDTVIAKLDEITAYIASDDPVAAVSFVARLVDLGESLAIFPNRSRARSNDVREMPSVPPYILRYRVIGDFVVIVDIRHNRRRPLP